VFDPSIKGVYLGRLALSPDGKTLAVPLSRDGRVELLFYDPATGMPANVGWPGHGGGIALRFAPDGKALAVGGTEAVRVFSFPEGKRLHEFPLPVADWGGRWHAECVDFSPDGKHLATALRGAGSGTLDWDGPVVRVWDLVSDESVFSAGNHGQVATAVAFSPNGRLLAFFCENPGDVEVYDWRGCKRLTKFEADRNRYVTRLLFAPDGKTLFSCDNEPEVKRWVPTTGKPGDHLKGLGRVRRIRRGRSGRGWLTSASRGSEWPASRSA
jgi:WD40 repeat protein